MAAGTAGPGVSSNHWRRQCLYRAGQFLSGLWPVVSWRDTELARERLEPPAFATFQRMPPTDRRHAARLCRRVLELRPGDDDLAVAALLHDIGKLDRTGHGRVRLAHRVLHILLPSIAPGIWRMVSARPGRGPWHGFYLLRHHAELSATWARQLGISARACALIAAHENGPPAAELADTVALFRALDARS